MNNEGVSFLSVVPMRAEPSERSEMVSQLLFGEYFCILEQREKWLYIRSEIDGYQGWISSNMASASHDNIPAKETLTVVRSIYQIYSVKGKQIHLPGGSLIPSSVGAASFQLNGETYTFCGGGGGITTPPDNSSPAALAMQYLGAPYLWGGKTVFGIDCSALVQITNRMAGRQLPRDASQQAQTGSEITPDTATANDIAFFCNDNGKITHTGILCDANTIIHASGYVRIDRFDENGIFNENKYTHRLHSIRRNL